MIYTYLYHLEILYLIYKHTIVELKNYNHIDLQEKLDSPSPLFLSFTRLL